MFFASRRQSASARKLALVLLTLFSLVGLAEAATQRMLLLPGTYSIPAGGAADIPARCLDLGSETPSSGEKLGYSPAELSSVRISVNGGKSRSLQQSIDSGEVVVEGTGDHTSVRIRNLSSSHDVRVAIANTSVVAPDSSYSTNDLKSTKLVGRTEKSLDQFEVWEAVRENAAKQLGIKNPEFAKDEENDAYRMLDHAGWVRSNPSRAAAERAFIVHRAIAANKTPVYYLMTGLEPVRQFSGNQQLSDLAAHVRKLWGSTPGKPRLVLAGKGRTDDFDAARLTIELSPAAAGGGGAGTASPSLGGFDFEPPPGSGLRDVYGGKPWEGLLVSADPPRFRSEQKFGERGTVKALSRTVRMLTHMTIAVRRIVSNRQNLEAPRATIEMYLKNSVRLAADAAVADDPNLRNLEKGYAELVWDIDGQTGKQYVVTIEFRPGEGNWLVNVVTREVPSS